MKKLISLLQNAHAAELAAYNAYEGHWKSTTNVDDRLHIKFIQREEEDHIFMLEYMLDRIGAKPNHFKDLIFITMGKIISIMCYISGRWAVMYGAGIMERIGATSYCEIAKIADEFGQKDFVETLCMMGYTEETHGEYFMAKAMERNEMKKLFKYLLLFVVVPVLVVLMMRSYIVNYAINSFQFGCQTAAQYIYKFNSKPLGLELNHFCDVYTNNIKKEFDGEFDK